jgi:hypothetical protein
MKFQISNSKLQKNKNKNLKLKSWNVLVSPLGEMPKAKGAYT